MRSRRKPQPNRYHITQCGHFVYSFRALGHTKSIVEDMAKNHGIFNYKAVDTLTGESWGFNLDSWEMESTPCTNTIQ